MIKKQLTFQCPLSDKAHTLDMVDTAEEVVVTDALAVRNSS
jgi:hypothetical protein